MAPSSADFRPAPLLSHPDAQTIFANFWRPRPGPPKVVRERWELPDGDFLDIDIADAAPADASVGSASSAGRRAFGSPAGTLSGEREAGGRSESDRAAKPPRDGRRAGPEGKPNDPPKASGANAFVPDSASADAHGRAGVALLCHGLEGSSSAPYIRGLSRELVARGFSTVALNFRGCGGTLNRLPRNYHSGDTGDVAFVIDRLVAEAPGRPVVVAGFSLGGNVLTKYLGERGDSLPSEVRGGAVVSVPFDLGACCRRLDGPGALMAAYRYRFMTRLKSKAVAKGLLWPGSYDVDAVRRSTTVQGFDGLVTAPLFGFASADDYYARSSSGPFLADVRRPLLALSAVDDPMVPGETLPVDVACGNSRFVDLRVVPHGGHTAFVDGHPLRPGFWAERTAADFLAGLVR